MITIFEQYNLNREVNLIQFFNDFEKCKHQLNDTFISHIRNMLIGKKISFIDKVMFEEVSGIVNEINFNRFSYSKTAFLSIYFEDDKNTYTFPLTDKSYYSSDMLDVTPMMKIYNSDITPIEKEVERKIDIFRPIP